MDSGPFWNHLMQIGDIQCVWTEVLSLTECRVANISSIRGERFWPECVRFEVTEDSHAENLVCG